MTRTETTLGAVIELHDNKRVPLNSRQRAERQGSYPYYGAQGIIDWVDDFLYEGRYLLVPEDGENLRSRKLPIAFFASGRFWVNNHAHVLRGKQGVADDDFLKHWLNNADIAGFVTGAAQPKLSQDGLRRIPIALPDLPTQRRIASTLSAYDELIENNARRIAILEEIARRTYEEWFVHFRFPGHEQVRMVESGLGLIPEGWQWKTLRDLACDVRSGVSPEQIEPSTPYVGLEHIPRRSIALCDWGSAGEVQSTKLRFSAGDILFGKIRPYFHKVAVAPVDGVASSDAIIIRAKEPSKYPLVLATVSSDAFVAEATQSSNGTKMPRANWEVLLSYNVACPPAPMITRFNEFMEPTVTFIRTTVLKNRNLRTTRDLLLPKLISGDINVPDIPEQEEAVQA